MIIKEFMQAANGKRPYLQEVFFEVRSRLGSGRYSHEEKLSLGQDIFQMGDSIDPKSGPVSQLLLANLMNEFPDLIPQSGTAQNLVCATFSTLEAMAQCAYTAQAPLQEMKRFAHFLTDEQRMRLEDIMSSYVPADPARPVAKVPLAPEVSANF